LKKNSYNVNAEESAFRILAKMSAGTQSSFIDQMMSSHPDSQQRADDAKARAKKDGLYKPYVQKMPTTIVTRKKTTSTKKKTTTKKK